LILEVDSNVARIGVEAVTWTRFGETVLFAIAQNWRLDAINRALDKLADWARKDLEQNATFASVIRRSRARELRAQHRALARLILDLPEFEGSLTNPRGYLGAGQSVRLYRRVRARLGLDRKRREIDERVEVIESIFDSLVESLNHFQALAFQIVLELAIVALLLVDVGLYLLDAAI
jgi:hypothetical protein